MKRSRSTSRAARGGIIQSSVEDGAGRRLLLHRCMQRRSADDESRTWGGGGSGGGGGGGCGSGGGGGGGGTHHTLVTSGVHGIENGHGEYYDSDCDDCEDDCSGGEDDDVRVDARRYHGQRVFDRDSRIRRHCAGNSISRGIRNGASTTAPERGAHRSLLRVPDLVDEVPNVVCVGRMFKAIGVEPRNAEGFRVTLDSWRTQSFVSPSIDDLLADIIIRACMDENDSLQNRIRVAAAAASRITPAHVQVVIGAIGAASCTLVRYDELKTVMRALCSAKRACQTADQSEHDRSCGPCALANAVGMVAGAAKSPSCAHRIHVHTETFLKMWSERNEFMSLSRFSSSTKHKTLGDVLKTVDGLQIPLSISDGNALCASVIVSHEVGDVSIPLSIPSSRRGALAYTLGAHAYTNDGRTADAYITIMKTIHAACSLLAAIVDPRASSLDRVSLQHVLVNGMLVASSQEGLCDGYALQRLISQAFAICEGSVDTETLVSARAALARQTTMNVTSVQFLYAATLTSNVSPECAELCILFAHACCTCTPAMCAAYVFGFVHCVMGRVAPSPYAGLLRSPSHSAYSVSELLPDCVTAFTSCPRRESHGGVCW